MQTGLDVRSDQTQVPQKSGGDRTPAAGGAGATVVGALPYVQRKADPGAEGTPDRDGAADGAKPAGAAGSLPGGRVPLRTVKEQPFKPAAADTKVTLPAGTRVFADADPAHLSKERYLLFLSRPTCAADVERSVVLAQAATPRDKAQLERAAPGPYVPGSLPIDAFAAADRASAAELDALLKTLDAGTFAALDPKLEALWGKIADAERQRDTARLVLDAVLKASLLTGNQIALLRKWLGRVPDAGQQARYNEQIAQRTMYRNQRNNEGRYVSGDSMCNVTSMAMAFETAGITQAKVADVAASRVLAAGSPEGIRGRADKMLLTVPQGLLADVAGNREAIRTKLTGQMMALQFEDLLDAFLQLYGLNRLDSTHHQRASYIVQRGRTDFSSKDYREHEKKNRMSIAAGTSDAKVKTFFLETVKPRLEAGAGATLSSSAWYHFVRLQWVDGGGATVDDPFGSYDVKTLDGAKPKRSQYNQKTPTEGRTTARQEAKGARGQDNRYPWAFLGKFGCTVNFFGG
jgi:hypothetical protein